ncbi:MarR family transcriptional regulator [Fodinicola feengrottensis]|uniref:MarR family transcriptional regulator n=1 Tax=Fodinicola feengrottensis TaxID=435914 RepID=A0ABN2J0W8_9ACTN
MATLAKDITRPVTSVNAATDSSAERDLVHEWHELLARHSTVSCAIERALQEGHGLGVSEFEALERLVEMDKDQCRGQDLFESLPLSQSAASRLIARLEREGLVTREICELDRRAIFICITDAGRARYQAARPTQRAVLAATMH